MKKIIVLTMICALVFSLTAWGATPETDSENEQNTVTFAESADLMDEVAQLWSAGDDAAAIALLEEAADQDDIWAQYMLADIYLSEESGEHYEEAVNYLEILADKGLTEAQDMLGMCYENGLGVDQDYEKAFEYYQMAADDGFPEALYMLGTFYENGWGVDEDEEAAQEYFQLAADGGYDEVLYSIAYMYFYGDGTDIDYETAVEYLTDAYELGSADAMFLLGMCYEEGYGVEQDLEMAAELYQAALDAGYEPDEEDAEILAAILGEAVEAAVEEDEYIPGDEELAESLEALFGDVTEESDFDPENISALLKGLFKDYGEEGEEERSVRVSDLFDAIDNHLLEEISEYLEAGDETFISHIIGDVDEDEDGTIHLLGYFTIMNFDVDEECPDDLLVNNGIGLTELLTLEMNEDGEYEVTDCITAEDSESYSDSVAEMCEYMGIDPDTFYEVMEISDLAYVSNLHNFLIDHPDYDHIEYMGELVAHEDLDNIVDELFADYLAFYGLAELIAEAEAA